MLRHDELDDRSFHELADGARRLIAAYCPEWTDQNAHDPGMMLTELFAWLTEMMRFSIAQSEDAEALFPLLGITRRRAAAAYVMASLLPGGIIPGVPAAIPKGTPLMAEDIRFETETPFIFEGLVAEEERAVPFYPFGPEAEAGHLFILYLRGAYQPGRTYLWEVSVRDPKPGRVAIDPNRPLALAAVRWEYRTAGGFEPMDVKDETYGFITGGLIHFTARKPMLPEADGRFALRCVLIKSAYDTPPRVEAMRPYAFRAWQRETRCEVIRHVTEGDRFTPGSYLSECGESMLFYESGGVFFRIHPFIKNTVPGTFSEFAVNDAASLPDGLRRFYLLNCAEDAVTSRILGLADGFPHQRFRAETKDAKIIYDDFTLWVFDSPSFARATEWQKAENLYNSSPFDRHYTLDSESGEIRFGDGINGAMPKGVVMVVSLALTHGAGGHIAARQLNGLSCETRWLAVTQPEAACGGREKESAAEAAMRAKEKPERAVTAEDYEKLVRSVPGLVIEQAHAYAGPAPFRVMIAVKPPGEHARLFEAYRRHIREYLEPYRLAGCEIEIVTPRYTRVNFFAEIMVYPYRYGVETELQAAFKTFFEKHLCGFGAYLDKTRLITELSTYPAVARVHTLEIRPAALLRLAPDTLACWGGLELLIR